MSLCATTSCAALILLESELADLETSQRVAGSGQAETLPLTSCTCADALGCCHIFLCVNTCNSLGHAHNIVLGKAASHQDNNICNQAEQLGVALFPVHTCLLGPLIHLHALNFNKVLIPGTATGAIWLGTVVLIAGCAFSVHAGL